MQRRNSPGHSDGSSSRSPPSLRVEEEEEGDFEEYIDEEEQYMCEETSMMINGNGGVPMRHREQALYPDVPPPTWVRSTSSSNSNSSSKSEDSMPHFHNSDHDRFNHHEYYYSKSDPGLSSSPPSSPTAAASTSAAFFSQGGFFYLAFCLCALTAMVTSRATLTTTLQQVALLDSNRVTMETQLQSAERGLLRIKRQVQAMDAMREQQVAENNSNDPNGSSSVKPKRVTAFELRLRNENNRALKELHGLQTKLKDDALFVSRLQQQVQDTARRDVLEKYGPGPHRIEMELVFPDRKVGGANKFVIELADVQVMPHSTFTFLEMASLGLLDGCSFIMNALHVVKAAPLPFDGSSAADKAQAFTKAGLESVAFREYSPEYPHKQYTVGFAADGSPSFYINTEDNSEVHVGDPCFGRIVSGLEAIKRLEACPTRNGIWFEKRIGIKAAKILKDSR